MRRIPHPSTSGAVQLRLPLTPPCEWHAQDEAKANGAAPCARDAQVQVTDPVRGRRACCCTTHALTLVALWRQSVPNRRRNAGRVALAWLPDVPRRVALPPVIGRRRAGA
jgi:hypothetical protein